MKHLARRKYTPHSLIPVSVYHNTPRHTQYYAVSPLRQNVRFGFIYETRGVERQKQENMEGGAESERQTAGKRKGCDKNEMRDKAAGGERSTIGSWYEEGNEKEKDV